MNNAALLKVSIFDDTRAECCSTALEYFYWRFLSGLITARALLSWMLCEEVEVRGSDCRHGRLERWPLDLFSRFAFCIASGIGRGDSCPSGYNVAVSNIRGGIEKNSAIHNEQRQIAR